MTEYVMGYRPKKAATFEEKVEPFMVKVNLFILAVCLGGLAGMYF